MKKGKNTKKIINADNVELKNKLKILIINFSIYIIIFLIFILICLISGINRSDMNYISLIPFTLSSLICGYVAGFKARKKGLYIGALNILPVLVVFLLISAAINTFEIDILRTVLSIILMIISGGIGGILGVNTRLKPKKKRGK